MKSLKRQKGFVDTPWRDDGDDDDYEYSFEIYQKDFPIWKYLAPWCTLGFFMVAYVVAILSPAAMALGDSGVVLFFCFLGGASLFCMFVSLFVQWQYLKAR